MSTPVPTAGPRPRASQRTPAKAPRPVERPGRVSLLWRRKRGLLRPVAWSVLAVLVVGAGATLVRTVQPGSTVASWREKLGASVGLTVNEVVIEGREKTPEPLLRAALGINRGDKLMGFSLEAVRARVEQLAWIQSATVERRLPGTIVVTLQERQPYAVWQSEGRFVLIDKQGQAVAKQDPAKDTVAFATLPLVVGAGAPEMAAALLDQLAQYPMLRSRVVAAVRVGQRRWNLRLSTGCDVMLPEGQETVALVRLQELQTTQQILDRPLAVIDLRLPEKMVVRPGPEPKPGATPKRPT